MENETAIIKYLKVARSHYERVILENHLFSRTLRDESIKEIGIINKILKELDE